MRRIVNHEQVRRMLAAALAAALILSMLPLQIFAAEPGTVTTNIGEKEFTVGTAVEFTITTTANDDAGILVLGSTEFNDPTAVEKLEYFEIRDGNWYELAGDFGPATGFPMSDATSLFRVTFRKAGVFSAEIVIRSIADGTVICSTTATATVNGSSSCTTDADGATFVVGEPAEFSISTIANADFGRMVMGSMEFSDPDAIELLEYYENRVADWFPLAGEFGPETGFPLTDAASRFRVTFGKPGVYSFSIYLKEVGTGDIVCFVSAAVTVKERSVISFTEDTIEIRFTDVNAINDTLVDAVEGAEYSYQSDNESVVLVNEFGILTPVCVGEAVITVTRAENAAYMAASASYTVKVLPGEQGELVWEKTVPASIRWNDAEGYSNTVSGGSGSGAVVYSSDNPEVAEVDPVTGVLTLKKPGTVTITAEKDGGDLYDVQTASYTLVVTKAEQAPLIFSESNPDAILVGEFCDNPAAGGSVAGPVVYTSSDATIAAVDEIGVVTALRVPFGMDHAVVEITASLAGDEYYEDAIPVTYTITIYRAAQTTPLLFEKGTDGQRMTYGEAYVNAAAGGDTKPIVYRSSDDAIASVDVRGRITAHKAGIVTITATALASEEYEAQSLSYVLVIDRAEQTVKFAEGTTNIPAIAYGESFRNPASAATKVTYTSSDPSVAEVDENGTVTPRRAGTVTITAFAESSEQYLEASSSYTITINKAKQIVGFEKGESVVITFNDNGNVFSNPAFSNATRGDEEDRKDVRVLYELVSGAEYIVDGTFDAENGTFEIKGAGTIILSVSFSSNDRYEEAAASCTVVVEKCAQTVSFEHTAYEMINGDNSFSAPAASEKGLLYGTGSIVYSIEKNSDDVVSAIDAATGALVFTNRVGQVTVRAVKAADDNYKEATAAYTLTVRDAEPDGQVFHSLVGDKTNESEWFTGNVSVVAEEGYLLSFYEDVDRAEWVNSFTDVVTDDGVHEVTFYARHVESGRIYRAQTITIKRDTVVPTAEIIHDGLSGWEKFLSVITLGLWTPSEMHFTVVSGDATAGVDQVGYYVAMGTAEVMDEAALDSLPDSAWTEYGNGIDIPADSIFVVYARVFDHAGLRIYAATNGIVFDRSAVPDDQLVIDVLTADSHGFYDGDVELRVEVTDALPSSGINTVFYEVFNGSELTQGRSVDEDDGVLYRFGIENPMYADLTASWSSADAGRNIIVDAAKNNSDNVRVVITVVDNAGNRTTKELPLKICAAKPAMEIRFIDDPAAIEEFDGVTYFNADRTAEIVITGRTSVFLASETPVVVVSETNGDAVKGRTYEVLDWVSTEDANDPDASVHSCLIRFHGSANYSLSAEYTDIFGNHLTADPGRFTVDHDVPEASVSIEDGNVWTRLLETLTFGLWSNSRVTVKAEVRDATSPIRSVEYVKDSGERIMTTTELVDADWQAFEEFTVDRDEQFVIYLKVTDRAGHVRYVCSDGFIVDMTEGNIAITPDAPNENGFYGDSFDVRIDVEDPAPYSGLRTVEYWVTNNGIETERRTLYACEYIRDEGQDSNGGTLRIFRDGELISEQTGCQPSQADLAASLSRTLTVDAAANNSDHVKIHVRAEDLAGNVWEKETNDLKIDVTAPTIRVSFDVNDPVLVGERGYFGTNRVATIVYTERTSGFDPRKATDGILFTGVDGRGESIEPDRSSMIVWGETVEVPGDPDAATHTAYVYFTEDANYEFTLSYTDEAGHECTYPEVVFDDDTAAPRFFTVDKVSPSASITAAETTWDKLVRILTFGLYRKDTVTVTAEVSDLTSPFTVEYYKTNQTKALDKADLDALDPSAWTTFAPFEIPADERLTVYLKAADQAGNYSYISTDGIVVDMTESVLTLSLEPTEMYHGSIPLYNQDVSVLIKVAEKTDEAYSGINRVEYWVKCDGKETQREVLYSFTDEAPGYEELQAAFARTVVIDSSLNNSCDVVLYAGVTDNAGNYVEKSVAVDIDSTAPAISVSYDNNDCYKLVGGKGYFPAGRTATVVITERTAHFDAVKASGNISITAVDGSGQTVIADCSALIGEWVTEGIGNGATHTATIDFSAEANYTFAIGYTDLAMNPNDGIATGSSAAPFAFAVDRTAPTGTVSAGAFGTWDKLIEFLTFGLWSRDTIEITGTASDITTSVESVSYYKTSDTSAKTVSELKAITDWAPFNGLTVPSDEQLVVYLRIVDDAGNVTYISTNGLIVDETMPEFSPAKPEITITPEPAHGIYHSDVAVGVTVRDPEIGETRAFAGIKEVRYEVYNLGVKTQDGVLCAFDIADPEQKDLLQTWSNSAAITVDKNLNNSNDVRIVVYAVDNAGNANTAECTISIDVTAPRIAVSYDNNDGDKSFGESVYFKAGRTAEIVVTERNFDPDMVNVTITGSDGYTPVITDWTTVPGSGNGDDATHTAHVLFDRDGVYTFDITCTDTADNANSPVDYADSLAPSAFTIDKTAPVVGIEYDNNAVVNGNYYAAQRIATITVTEHNFETGRVRILLKATDDGVDAPLPEVSEWMTDGDVHTATITFAADSLYVFDFDYTDKAGNATADIAEQTFYVDMTRPSLRIEKIVDGSANNSEGSIGFVMTATDTNFDVFTPVLTAVVKNGDSYETKQIEIGRTTDITNGKVYTVTNIEADGIYRITCTVVDKADNAFTEVVLERADGSTYTTPGSSADTLVTFSVNRAGSAYEVDENTVRLSEQYYVRNVEADIVLVEVNVDPLKEFAVTLNGRALEKDTDFTVAEEGGNGAWMKYTYTVNHDLFAEEGEYKLVLSSRDQADNYAFSDVKQAAVAFVVDRTAPVVTVSGIANGGRYQTARQLVTLIPTDDGGALQSLVVNLIDEDGIVLTELLNLSGETLTELLETNGGMITFEIAEGLYQNVQIICSDCAGGENEASNTREEIITNVSVSSNVFMIFWSNKPLRWGTIAGVSAAAIAAAVLLIIKKRKPKAAV